MIIRLGMPLVVTAAQLGAAALALGRPDFGPALAFLGDGWPTAAETLAALELLVWAIVLAGMAWSLGVLAWSLGNRAVASPRLPTPRNPHPATAISWGPRVREASVLATGLLILVAGAAHHATRPVGMSGGTVQEAQSFLGH